MDTIGYSNSHAEHSFCPQLIIVENGEGYAKLKTANLKIPQVFIGRADVPGTHCNILLRSPLVSKMHGMITEYNGDYYYNDCENLNGTFYNGEFINHFGKKVSDKIKLNDGDVLMIGKPTDAQRVIMIFSTTTSTRNEWRQVRPVPNMPIRIGRAPQCEICLPVITVSREHARITFNGSVLSVRDNNSYNGTYVNGRPVTEAIAEEGSVIMVGPAKIVYINGTLFYSAYRQEVAAPPTAVENPFGVQGAPPAMPAPAAPIVVGEGNEIVVNNISRMVKCKKGTGINGSDKKYILQNISLTIRAGELVAICGGSGAGKTTFMNAINGFEPGTSGDVSINGVDLYRNYSQLKSRIGYVPQQDIVHDNLTGESMRTYTAKLRLPKDITNGEISQIVANVLEMVDLTKQTDTFIKKLSGGQRKRASIAVELVADPAIFFLDEPTSGLDPEAETHLMHSLKRLSNEKKKTVLVITHTLQNIDVFDKIIFLAPGGKLCFFGSIDDARKFFGVSNLVDAYEKISQDIDGYVEKYERLREGALV